VSRDTASYVVLPRIPTFEPTKVELKRLRKLFKKMAALSTSRDVKEISWNEYFERDRVLRAQVNSIARDVGLRTLGELPLTLREAGWTATSPRKPVVVLEYQVFQWEGRLEWSGSGVELRKDGSVGEARGDMALDRYPLFRRHLDGSWAPLSLPPKC